MSMQVSLAAVPGSQASARDYWVSSIMIQSAMVASRILMASVPLAFVICEFDGGSNIGGSSILDAGSGRRGRRNYRARSLR